MFPSLRDDATRAASAAETADEIIRRRRTDGAYAHAYQTFDEGEIRRQAAAIDRSRAGSPLNAVPVSVKDAFGVDGFPTYGGGRTRLADRWAQDSGLVKALRERGALFTGKTQMVELALGALGQNPHWGAPVNPWDATAERVCGGSSCGAGPSLWDGTAAVAVAADTGGSVRMPASMTGAVGFRPTQGTWSFGDSYLAVCPTLDGPGILTLSVADAMVVYRALGGTAEAAAPHDSLAGVRLGVVRDRLDEAQADIAGVVSNAVDALAGAGASIVEMSFPEYAEAAAFYGDSQIAAIECTAFLDTYLPGTAAPEDPFVRARTEPARSATATRYVQSLGRRRQLMAGGAARMQACDVLVMPTLPMSPPRFSDIAEPAAYSAANRRASLLTNPVNVMSLSALTMPAGKDTLGLPVGLQLVAAGRDDARLLCIALAVEKVLGSAADVLGMPPRRPQRPAA